MRVTIALLMVLIVVNSMQINLTIDYSNPSALTYLKPSYMHVSIDGNLSIRDLKFNNLKVSVETVSKSLQEKVEEAIERNLTRCLIEQTPLISIARCVTKSIFPFIGVSRIISKNVTFNEPVLLPNGHVLYSIKYSMTMTSESTFFNGYSVYQVEGGSENFNERLHIILLSSGENAYFKLSAKSSSELGDLAEYYLANCNKAKLILTSVNPSSPPQILNIGGITKIVFTFPTIRYVISVFNDFQFLPVTSWQYYESLAKDVIVPLSCNTVKKLSSLGTSEYSLECESEIVVASNQSNSILIESLKGLKIRSTAPPYVSLRLAIPCSGDAILRVNNSTLITSFDLLSNSKIIVIPNAPVLRLVKVESDEKFALIIDSNLVECPKECYLAIPPTTQVISIASLNGSRISKSLVISPTTTSVYVKVPKPVSYTACGAFLVSPEPISVDLYFNSTLMRLKVGPYPQYVLLPCKVDINAKVNNSYYTTFRVNDGDWVAFCPGNGVKSGHTIEVYSELPSPLSVSCNSGHSWVVVKKDRFKLIVPDYPVLPLRVIGSDDSESSLLVPLGINEIRLPILYKKQRNETIIPPQPLTEMIKLNLHGAENGILKLRKDIYTLSYVISNETIIALPKDWVSSTLSATLIVNENNTLRMLNFTLPVLKVGNSLSDINIFVNTTYAFYNYYTVRIVVEDQGGNVTKGIVILDNKYRLPVNGATVIVYPKKLLKITFNGKEYNIALNGQTVYLKVPSEEHLSNLDAYMVIHMLRPVSAIISISDGEEYLKYFVNSSSTYIAIPSDWLSKYLLLNIIVNQNVHKTQIPPLLTNFNGTAIQSPLYILIKETPSYNYYSSKIIAVYDEVNKPANVDVILDDKYNLQINGSIVLVYPKKEVTLTVLNKKLKFNLGGNEIIIKIPYKRELPRSPPPYPLDTPINVYLYGLNGTNLVLTDGMYSLNYVLSQNKTSVLIPQQWLETPLTILIDNNTIRGVKLSYNKVPASISIICKGYQTNPNYRYATVVTQYKGTPIPSIIKINGIPVRLDNGVGIIIVPSDSAVLQVSDKIYNVKLDGTTIVIDVPTPQKVAPVNATVTFTVLKYGKPYDVKLKLYSNDTYLEYSVNGTTTVMVPYEWLSGNIDLEVIEKNGIVHKATLPPLLISKGFKKLVAPVVIYLDDPLKYDYHSTIIEIIESRSLFKDLSKAKIKIDDKYELEVNGAVALVYPRNQLR